MIGDLVINTGIGDNYRPLFLTAMDMIYKFQINLMSSDQGKSDGS